MPPSFPPREVVPCDAKSLEETLTLAFDPLSSQERTTRTQGLLELFEKGDLSLGGIFRVQQGEKLLGAIFSQTRQDKTVLIWPPVWL